MELIEKLKATINGIHEKEFYAYAAGIIGAILLLMILFMFYFYRSSSAWKKKIETLNTTRATTVRQLITRAQKLKKQKERINSLIEREPDFRFAAILEAALAQLKLTEKSDSMAPKTVDIDDKYSESIIELNLNDINMRQLVEFLTLLDTNRRIYTKRLEISKSKTTTTTNKLEAALTIATLTSKSA